MNDRYVYFDTSWGRYRLGRDWTKWVVEKFFNQSGWVVVDRCATKQEAMLLIDGKECIND